MQRESEYQNQTDEMLIEALRNGRPDITDYIMEKYKYLVRRRANAMFLIGGDTDDLIQEGMIGLFKAIRDYRREKDASFFILPISVSPDRFIMRWKLPREKSISP